MYRKTGWYYLRNKFSDTFYKDISAFRKATNFLKDKNKLIYFKKSLKWVQSGPCYLNHLEMAIKRTNTIILKIREKIMIWDLKELDLAYSLITSVSRKARDF